jgi:hypothetical protein
MINKRGVIGTTITLIIAFFIISFMLLLYLLSVYFISWRDGSFSHKDEGNAGATLEHIHSFFHVLESNKDIYLWAQGSKKDNDLIISLSDEKRFTKTMPYDFYLCFSKEKSSIFSNPTLILSKYNEIDTLALGIPQSVNVLCQFDIDKTNFYLSGEKLFFSLFLVRDEKKVVEVYYYEG